MAIYYFPMRYQFGAGGEPEEVTADQRDVAAWEAEPFGDPITDVSRQPVTFWRYLAWSASKRAGRHGMSWKAWQDDCIWADYDMPEDVAEDAEDPGPPGQSATP